MSSTDEAPAPPRGLLRSLRTALALQWRTAPAASAGAFVLTALTGSSAAVGALLAKHIVDALTADTAVAPTRVLTLGAAAGAVIGLTMLGLQLTQYLDTIVRRRVTLAVERTLFEKVVALPGLRYFEDPGFQGRLRMAERAAQEAPYHFTELAQALVRAAVTLMTLIGVVLLVSPLLAVVLLLVGVMGLVAQVMRSRTDLGLMEEAVASTRWQDFYRSLLLDIRAAKEMRLFGIGGLLLGRMVGAIQSTHDREIRLERRSAAVQVVLALSTAAIGSLGAFLVVRGILLKTFQVGDVALFIGAVAGIQNAFTGLLVMVGMTGRTLLMFQNYLEVLDLPTEAPGGSGVEAPPLRQGIELRDVWFRYGPEAPWVLQGVDLSIPAGATVGLVGLNGAGKSTLVKLLCRFYEPERGAILWDGIDVRTLDPRALRRRLGATFQDFMTYDLTARENIGLGDPRHLEDRERIADAAKRVELHAVLAALPHGYDTLLSRTLPDGEEPEGVGTSLSGGQWQRLALARSLLRADVDLLILDEPSSGLDAEAEARIHETFRQYGKGRARLLISHRLSAMRAADVIVVLSAGRIVEHGTHESLRVAGGEYARLFALQASGYQDEPTAPRAMEGFR